MDHEVAVTLLKGVRELWREVIIAWRDRQDALGKLSEPLLEIRNHIAASAADHREGYILLAHRANDLQPVVEVRAREYGLRVGGAQLVDERRDVGDAEGIG